MMMVVLLDAIGQVIEARQARSSAAMQGGGHGRLREERITRRRVRIALDVVHVGRASLAHVVGGLSRESVGIGTARAVLMLHEDLVIGLELVLLLLLLLLVMLLLLLLMLLQLVLLLLREWRTCSWFHLHLEVNVRSLKTHEL